MDSGKLTMENVQMDGLKGLTQTKTLMLLVALYILAAVIFIFVPGGSMDMSAAFSGAAGPQMPAWQIALGNAGIILVLYAGLGLIGLVLTRKLGWPGIYRVGASRRELFLHPLVYGVAVGLILVIVDLLAQQFTSFEGFAHPAFPASILASLSAAIGEEIMFRLFMMSLWAALLSWLSPRLLPGRQTGDTIFWIANLIGALTFAASHLGTAMILAGVSSPAALHPVMLAEMMVLNGLLGLVAGWVFRRDGLLAAAGVHFWADIIWHVLFGLLG
jgi:hypothetical protein